MFAVTTDAEWIRSIITHPQVWPWVAPRGTDPATYEPGPGVYTRCERGLMYFAPWTTQWWDVHIAMLPKSPPAGDFVRASLEHMRQNGARGFIARIPAYNAQVLRLAKREGFTLCGSVSRCFNGSDLLILERD